MEKRKTVIVMIKKGDKFFIAKRSPTRTSMPNKWQFVAGHIEKNEDEKNAAIREAKEETGLKIKIKKIGKKYIYFEKEINTTWIITPLLCEYQEGEVKIDREHSEFRWAKREEMNKLDFVPLAIENLDKLIK